MSFDLYVFLYNAWYFLLLVPLLVWWGFHDDRNTIYLEPPVCEALLDYFQRVGIKAAS